MSTTKYLDKIRKARSKGNLRKAMGMAVEALTAYPEETALRSEVLGLSFQTQNWTDSLERLRTFLRKDRLRDLCGGENRADFIRLTQDYSGFRSLLLDDLLTKEKLCGIADWFSLCEGGERFWLIDNWSQIANDVSDVKKRAGLLAAVGVGHFVEESWDAAWQAWILALQADNALLKRIIHFVQQSTHTDLKKLSHRLLFIKLIHAAGRKKQTVSLLQALASESADYNRRVLTNLHRILGDAYDDVESLRLRFNLALQAGDEKELLKVIHGLRQVDEAEWFPFRKKALHKIEDQNLRRAVLRAFAELYMSKGSWENAALLLEVLYEQQPEPRLVVLMERVLHHYPIMVQLHVLIGRHHLFQGERRLAMQHLNAVRDLPEFEKSVRAMLEDYLEKHRDVDIAKLLLDMLHPTSHKAGLTAWLIVKQLDTECEPFLRRWHQHKSALGPFWRLAMMEGHMRLGNHARCYSLFCNFIARYPELGSEVVRFADWLLEGYVTDYTPALERLQARREQLVPQAIWLKMSQRLKTVTDHYKRRTAELNAPAPAPDLDLSLTETQFQGTERPPAPIAGGTEINGLLAAGNWQAAAQVAMETAKRNPEKLDAVIAHLEELDRQYTQEPLWGKTILHVLQEAGDDERVIRVGQQMLSNPKYSRDLPDIYQLLAMGYFSSGKEAEALRFFCLSSRQPRYYKKNRLRLAMMVMPKHPHLLKEVMNLALQNEDLEVWQQIMRAWHDARPREIEHQIKAQAAFTHQVNSPAAFLEMAYWHLQAGDAKQVNRSLEKVDLREPDIKTQLVEVIEAVRLKFPTEPKPPFILGKYYLIQREDGKALDQFRKLVKELPKTAEPMFNYVRAYLRENPETPHLVRYYGLLVRFALDHASASVVVQLLMEFGQRDRAGAISLLGGVARVMSMQIERMDQRYEFAELLVEWGLYDRLLDFDERAKFGIHMAQERLNWFGEAQGEPGLRDRALLAKARLCLEMLEFDKCLAALDSIKDDRQIHAARALYERLASRFPDRCDVLCKAAWAAFPTHREKVIQHAQDVLRHADATHQQCLETYAILLDVGCAVAMPKSVSAMAANDRLLALRNIYGRLREAEMEAWQSGGGTFPVQAVAWLFASDQAVKVDATRAAWNQLPPAQAAELRSLDHYYQHRLGQAAWAAARDDVPLAQRQSLFYQAQMDARAVLATPPDQPVPAFIDNAFRERMQQPRMIALHGFSPQPKPQSQVMDMADLMLMESE